MADDTKTLIRDRKNAVKAFIYDINHCANLETLMEYFVDIPQINDYELGVDREGPLVVKRYLQENKHLMLFGSPTIDGYERDPFFWCKLAFRSEQRQCKVLFVFAESSTLIKTIRINKHHNGS